MGPIGRNIARLLRTLGMRTVGVRRSAEAVDACDHTIPYGDLPSVLATATAYCSCRVVNGGGARRFVVIAKNYDMDTNVVLALSVARQQSHHQGGTQC